MRPINRPAYLKTLRSWRDKDVIKVITGVRRCGKSTLLSLFQNELLADGVPESRIIDINLELIENERLLDYRALHNEILSRCDSRARNYVFIDEVQNVPDFQRAVDSLYARDNIDLYITGSNALLLRGTLATLLSGRYVEIQATPFSFAEFCSCHADGNTSPRRLWSEYLHTGGFPAMRSIDDERARHDYLTGILDTVLLKDVAQRLNIANTNLLGALSAYLFDNVGNLTNPKRISDALTSNGMKTSPATISEYLSGLCNSYIFYPVQRYDLKGRRLLELQRKYYAVDPGMRRAALSGADRDTGRLLEGTVYFELLRREGPVYVGRGPAGEVDFITHGSEGVKYYQVCESVVDPGTRERELSSLRAIPDNHPKYLLTLDDERPTSHDGIQQLYVLDWLLEESQREGRSNTTQDAEAFDMPGESTQR